MEKAIRVLWRLFNKTDYRIKMTLLIIDTSVALKWLNQDNEKYVNQADRILKTAKDGQVELLAPELIKYEIGNVLLYGKKITSQDVVYLLSIFYSLPITFITESEDLAKETYDLAFNLGITYYDASFMSLAKQYNATLVTENIKHQGKSTKVKVKSLQGY